MWPLSRKSLRSQRALQTLQPKLDALKEKYKDSKEKLGAATMELYKKEKINPLSSCLPMLIQLPIIWAMFKVFRNGLISTDFSILYSFVSNPEIINPLTLGFLDLSRPQIALGVLAGAAQFWHTRILMAKKKKNGHNVNSKKDPAMTEIMSKQMMYFMPVLTIAFSAYLPGALALYWLITTLFSVVEQHFVNESMREEALEMSGSSNKEKEVIDIPSKPESESDKK